ncbi:unnamed protein product, partial [Iphiclides podalirius]
MEGVGEERGAAGPLADIEELVLCSSCRRSYDEAERAPKLLACKHAFCLACVGTVLSEGREVVCPHCSKRTEPPSGVAASLPTHGALLALARRVANAEPPPPAAAALWCGACGGPPTPACAAHAALVAVLRSHAAVARDTLLLREELRRLAGRRRDAQLRALDAATALKMRLEGELSVPAPISPPAPDAPPPPDPSAVTALPAAVAEVERLRARHLSALMRCRLDELIRAASSPLDFERMRRALVGLDVPTPPPSAPQHAPTDPVLFLANYCMVQLYIRDFLQQHDEGEGGEPLLRMPPTYPLFYFELDVDGVPCGRFVVEVRNDLAPRMARNFSMLTVGERGIGYRGCTVFQCFENESVITGDFEMNNGRGGCSVYKEGFFMPDDTKMAAVRGAVGMRRSQKHQDHLGLVGSQFRIILREKRNFTAIFAFVVEGLELVDRLSCMGDSNGKPHSTILIAKCGKLY